MNSNNPTQSAGAKTDELKRQRVINNVNKLHEKGASLADIDQYVKMSTKELGIGTSAKPNTEKQDPSTSKLASVGRFAEALPGAVAQTAIGDPVKLGVSAGEGMLSTFKTGQNYSDKTYNLPGLQPFKSFQSESMDRLKGGQGPVKNIAQSAFDIGSAGLNTIGVAETGLKAGKAVLERKAANEIWDMIKPELKAGKDIAEAGKGGQLKTTMFGGVKQAIPTVGRDAEMLEAAKPYVTGAKNELEAVQKMQGGIVDEATKLREGLKQSKATWSQKNLVGAIDKVERPHLLSGDLEKSFDKTLKVVLDKSKTADRNLSGLLDVRQAFDAEVAKQYPNLYNSDNMTAIKQAVIKTRSAINDLIEAALPEGKTLDGISFKDSLKKQSLLYDAIDNTAPKIKVGGPIAQFVKRNPRTATAIGTGATILGGEALYKGAKKIGAPLP